MNDNISYLEFDGGDYLVKFNSKLIGTAHKLIKGGWIGKSHIEYNNEVVGKTRKECTDKLIEIVKEKRDGNT